MIPEVRKPSDAKNLPLSSRMQKTAKPYSKPLYIFAPVKRLHTMRSHFY